MKELFEIMSCNIISSSTFMLLQREKKQILWKKSIFVWNGVNLMNKEKFRRQVERSVALGYVLYAGFEKRESWWFWKWFPLSQDIDRAKPQVHGLSK